MGIDCTLLPAAAHDGWGFAHTVLPLERRSDLWPRLRAVEPLPLDVRLIHFTSYLGRSPSGEHAYGRMAEDAYGEQLRFYAAGDLARVISEFDRHPTAAAPLNAAAAAYLGCLPAESPVAAYWH